MKTVRDTCKLRDEVLKGDLQDAIFAADFGHVVEGLAPDVYKDPTEFFRNTHPAAQLKKVVTTIFGRLADAKEAGAAIRLSTGFGGGKTHTLITLWHLANNIGKTNLGTELLPAAGRPKKVTVAGIDAQKFGAKVCIKHEDVQTHSLWGELAYQLGKKAGYNKLKSLDSPTALPDAGTVRDMLPEGPVLILLDELVAYTAHLREEESGALLAFIRMLVDEVLARKQAVIVITDPAGQAVYRKQAAALADASTMARGLDDILDRKMSDFDPIKGEAAQVINRRLFQKIDNDAAEKASAEYFSAYKRVSTEYPDALPSETSTMDYAQRIVKCYPFHPRLMETAQDRLGALQDFQKSRGTLRLFARILREVWEGQADIPLISAGDLNWESDRMQADLLQRLNKDNFIAAVNADVVRHAGNLDAQYSTDMHRRVASALLLESVPYPNPNAAMDKQELGLAVLRPTDVGNEAGEAIDRLISVCWHTYKDESGRRFQFRFEPNEIRLIDERTEGIPPKDAESDVMTLAQNYFGGKTFALIPFPSNPKSVPDSAELKFVLADSEKLAQAVCDFEDDSDPHAKRKRPFRNAIFGIAPSSDLLSDAIEAMRRLKAAEEILSEQKKKTLLRERIEDLLPALRKRARIRTIRAFNRMVFQGRPSVTLPEKYLVSEESVLESVRGQLKIKEFLDDDKNKYVYQPTDVLDADLLIDNIMKGATPSVDHEGAYPASAVYERALSNEKLRLMMNENPVRNAILEAVNKGKLAVLLPDGDAYDSNGCVSGPSGGRVRAKHHLQTLRLASDVFVAPIKAACVAQWMKETGRVKEGGKKGGGFEPPEQTIATEWNNAIQLAAKNPLLNLKLSAHSPDAAKTLVPLAQPFSAKSLSLSVQVGGQLKDGGTVNFSADGLKHNHPLNPIDIAARLLRAMGEGASFEAELTLDFGEGGIKNASDKFEKAREAASDEISLIAEFGKCEK